MAEINHRVGIKTTPDKIYQALTTNNGLMSWWTNDIRRAGEVGSIIEFWFNGSGPDFEITELVANKLVRWKDSGSMPEAWTGTEIVFKLYIQENQTFLNFSHSHWQESTNFMAHCNTKWAVFLLSLKDFLETGLGKPFPNDTQIDHS